MGKKGGKKKNASNVFSMFEPSQIQGIVHKLPYCRAPYTFSWES